MVGYLDHTAIRFIKVVSPLYGTEVCRAGHGGGCEEVDGGEGGEGVGGAE